MGSLTTDVIDNLDPWRAEIHVLRKPKGKPAPPDRFGEPTDVPFDDLQHLLLIWGEPTGRSASDGIRVRGCIVDVDRCPRAIKEFEANLNGGTSDTISLSSGMLQVDMHWLRRGIAAIALARLVEWAKKYHSDSKVAKYNIGPYEELKQKYLRRLYGQFGFVWDEKRVPEDQSVWKSNDLLVENLKLKAAPGHANAGAAASHIIACVQDMRVLLAGKETALRVSERKNKSRKLSWGERISGEKDDETSSKSGPITP